MPAHGEVVIKNILLIMLAAGLLGACSMLPGWLQAGPKSGLGEKTVSAKEAPATLVALDGTLCTAPWKYDRVKPGDRVFCHWRVRGEMGMWAADRGDRPVKLWPRTGEDSPFDMVARPLSPEPKRQH